MTMFAYGPKIHGIAETKDDLDQIVENSLKKAALWNEVKDRLARARHKLVRRAATTFVYSKSNFS